MLTEEDLKRSENSRNTVIELFGDREVNVQVVMLLLYIRNIINSNQQKDITVRIGQNIQNSKFNFTINDKLIEKDYIAKDIVSIN